jgi:general secretion pathway protein A
VYQSYFKLKKSPFGMTPDPYCVFRTESHREALSGLAYALLEGKGFVILTGEVGTGKTTILSRLLRFVPSTHAVFSVVLNPTLSASEFIEAVMMDFGIENIPQSKVHRLVTLQKFVTDTQASGRTCVLVVDEAHKLSPEVLEEIRLLTNFENAERKLLQILLVGQTELRELLNREDLRQIKQRIALRFELRPLSQNEVGRYMRFRWANAGGESELPFEPAAIHTIGEVSRGLPRLINAMCDNALMSAYASGDARVNTVHVGQAMRDLDLGRGQETLAAPTRNEAQADRLVHANSAAVANAVAQVIGVAPVNGVGQANGVAKTNGVSKTNGVTALALRLPPPLPMITTLPLGLRTLEKYIPPERKPPFLMRLVGKLRFATVERQNP